MAGPQNLSQFEFMDDKIDHVEDENSWGDKFQVLARIERKSGK